MCSVSTNRGTIRKGPHVAIRLLEPKEALLSIWLRFAVRSRGCPLWRCVLLVVGLGALGGAMGGCVETVDDFGGLSCTNELGCPTPYACVLGTCKRKLDTYTCAADVDCPVGLLCDPTEKFCRQCLSDPDCPGGRCYQGSHCVQCLAHAHCPFGQFCDAQGLRCLPCQGNCGDEPEPRVARRSAP